MDVTSPYSYKNFIIGTIISTAAGLYLIVTSLIIGRIDFFLLLNTDLGTDSDYFFRFLTYVGDGIILVPVAILFLKYQRSELPLLFSAIFFSTLITQLVKIFVFPEMLRPTAVITDGRLIHTVRGVELLSAYSFPSGHTTTVFCAFLLACLFIKNTWVIPIGFLFALLVGYSRIYLAQHFPLDVGAGMITAVISILLSLLVQKKWEDRRRKF